METLKEVAKEKLQDVIDSLNNLELFIRKYNIINDDFINDLTYKIFIELNKIEKELKEN